MTAIRTVATWRPHPGKAAEFMASVAAAKKIHQRMGCTVRVLSAQFGGVPTGISYVMEHASWAAFGAFGEKISADKEWLAFWAAAGANPTAELVSNTVLVELDV